MIIAILTDRRRIYEDFIRNYNLDKSQCVWVRDNSENHAGLYFDRIIYTCFHREISMEVKSRVLCYAKFGVAPELIPCTPNVCDPDV